MRREVRIRLLLAGLVGVCVALGGLAALSTAAAAHFHGAQRLDSVARLTAPEVNHAAWRSAWRYGVDADGEIRDELLEFAAGRGHDR